MKTDEKNDLTSYRMCEAVINLPVQSWRRKKLIARCENLVTMFGVAIQKTLEYIQKDLALEYDSEKRVNSSRFKVSISGKDIPRARNLLDQEMTKYGYTNAYHIVSLSDIDEGRAMVQFELAKANLSSIEGKNRRSFKTIPANFFKQIILGWCSYPELNALKASNRQGAAQKVAEQVISYLQLLDKDPNTAFPSTGERSPEAKMTSWLGALDRVCQNNTGFEYKLLRDIKPTIALDDPKGDRRVNVDSDWMEFSEGPKVDRFPVNFGGNDIVVYRRYHDEDSKKDKIERYSDHTGRLWAFIPYDGLEDKERWWISHIHEFEPLPAFKKKTKLSPKSMGLLVPIEYRDNLDILEDENRTVKWSLLTEEREYRHRHGHHGNNLPFLGNRWFIKFATETQITIRESETTLGLHFHNHKDKMTIYWSLANEGIVMERGELQQDQILDYALLKKAYMEGLQTSRKWIGGKQFRKELKRRTEQLAHRIVKLADSRSAEIVIEDIYYVKKQGQGPELNSRHSLWNYASLSTQIEFFAKDRAGLPTRRVNEFVLKFTCPACGAIRKGGQKREKATTWLEDNVLQCRRCSAQTPLFPQYLADRVALSSPE